MPCPFCILSVRDPNGVGYDAVYDPLGRMTSQTDTWGDTVSMTYDREGNVLTQTDAKGKVTTMVYDARNRRKTVTDRLAGVTTFNYHPAGHLASIVDAEGQMTAYEHNARGEKIKETYPDHVNGSVVGTPGYGIVQFDYDPAGRMLRKTDQVGDTVYFNYDMAGRVPQRDYRTAANSPNGPIADSDTFQFDVAGRMTSATSGRYTNVVGMTYDHAGRLSTESLSIAGQTYTVTREYDALNRIKKYIYPDGTQVERTYTDRGQLATIKYNGSVIDTRTYDLGGRLSTSTYSNGAVTTHTYRSTASQKDDLLASIATTNPGPNKVGTYSYTWDANKNKTSEAITNSPLSTHGFSTGATGYDDENRVTNWARSDSSQTQTWSLSPVGDWNTFNQTGAAPLTQTRTHGPTHEFNSFTGTTSGTLTYDVKGNLTSRPATLAAPALNLSWDMDNRLIGADTNGSSGSLEVTFQYDALGRRVARTESGATVIYFQAGQQTLLDYTSGAAPNSPTYRYVYGDYIDEPVLRVTASSNAHHFFHRNQQYSITALTDNSGNTAERYAYTAYGQLSVFDLSGSPLNSSSLNSPITYTGREWEPALVMHYFRARWLDPAAGRFWGRDPIGFLDGFSSYEAYFVSNGVDPSGMENITLVFNAFINGVKRGEWHDEPMGGFRPQDAGYAVFQASVQRQFRSNLRDFGEFDPGAENAKLYSFAEFDSDDIGNLESINFSKRNGAGTSKQRWRWFWPSWNSEKVQYGRWNGPISAKPTIDPSTIEVDDLNENTSRLTFTAGSKYPHVSIFGLFNPSPPIDYKVSFTVTKVCDWEFRGVHVELSGFRDSFPDYEAYAYESSSAPRTFYEFSSPDEGPGFHNLGRPMDQSVSGSETIIFEYF